MKGFKKLALVTAVAALPMSGFAMEALDDATMSDVTGQDGISISLGLNQTMDILVHDTDGLTGANAALIPAGYTESGGIFIDNMAAVGTATVEIDAGGNAGDGTGSGVLLVNVNLAAGFQVTTGDIYVVDTENALIAGTTPVQGASGTAILTSSTITFAGGVDLGIQLGAGAENFLNIVNGNIGTISMGTVTLGSTGAGTGISTGVTLTGIDLGGTTASLTTNGLVLDLGANLNAVGIAMTSLSLNGGTDTIGDVYITGLDLSTTNVTINGK
ncbi:DUF6160 family protein [Alcanivorax sp. 1008]|uniref:DUF6160 family protein n=1 Tax=Alcanivorax sp. 1008 TaxID=2816853 RepID=UPI001E0760FB|nr:DUF6160 family protein [Alcanivorax sp. 1008]MCC1498300.1 hypothetical protein [Alcanivorax sp. 1008]